MAPRQRRLLTPEEVRQAIRLAEGGVWDITKIGRLLDVAPSRIARSFRLRDPIPSGWMFRVQFLSIPEDEQ
jgi:hypothetical protein